MAWEGTAKWVRFRDGSGQPGEVIDSDGERALVRWTVEPVVNMGWYFWKDLEEVSVEPEAE